MKRVDLDVAVFSELTEELAQTNYTDERVRRYFRDKSFEADYRWLEETKFPGREVGVASRTRDERLWLISVCAAIPNPARLIYSTAARHAR